MGRSGREEVLWTDGKSYVLFQSCFFPLLLLLLVPLDVIPPANENERCDVTSTGKRNATTLRRVCLPTHKAVHYDNRFHSALRGECPAEQNYFERGHGESSPVDSTVMINTPRLSPRTTISGVNRGRSAGLASAVPSGTGPAPLPRFLSVSRSRG